MSTSHILLRNSQEYLTAADVCTILEYYGIPDDSVSLKITSRRRVNGRAEKIGVYADGESVFMLGGDESVEIAVAATRARFVELDGYDPYKALGRKLGWCGTSREWSGGRA